MIQKIRLTNFRNFKSKIFEFSDKQSLRLRLKQSLASSAGKITVIVGPNASGKTNILESLFLLSTGKSFHAKIEEEMVNYDDDIARVIGQVSSKQQVAGSMQKNHATNYMLHTTKLEAVLTRGLINIGSSRPEKVARKRLLVNRIPKRLIDFAGNFKVVLFGPWDLDLVTESPSIRRKFLDYVLSQIDREYRRASLSYEKGLRQRNRLLYKIREEGLSRSQLLFWDKLLIKNGDYISVRREEFIDFVNSRPSLNDQIFNIEYDRSAISETRLEQYIEEEIAAATTLVGPHRDDFIFKLKDRELARYGSRGEQRMGVLWLKLAELAFIEEKSGERPTLLLDDIFSELDDNHRKIVMKVSSEQQTIITTTDPHFIEKFENVEIIKL